MREKLEPDWRKKTELTIPQRLTRSDRVGSELTLSSCTLVGDALLWGSELYSSATNTPQNQDYVLLLNTHTKKEFLLKSK